MVLEESVEHVNRIQCICETTTSDMCKSKIQINYLIYESEMDILHIRFIFIILYGI